MLISVASDDHDRLPSANWSSLGTEGPLTELTEAPLFTTLHVIALEKRRTTQAEEHVTDASVGDSTSRDNVLALLKQVLDGDDICAQWTLLAIIARMCVVVASQRLLRGCPTDSFSALFLQSFACREPHTRCALS